jgi:hypothetical protein
VIADCGFRIVGSKYRLFLIYNAQIQITNEETKFEARIPQSEFRNQA